MLPAIPALTLLSTVSTARLPRPLMASSSWRLSPLRANCPRALRCDLPMRDALLPAAVEVFVNDGALVFSTRIYPETYGVTVDAPGASVTYHALNI